MKKTVFPPPRGPGAATGGAVKCRGSATAAAVPARNAPSAGDGALSQGRDRDAAPLREGFQPLEWAVNSGGGATPMRVVQRLDTSDAAPTLRLRLPFEQRCKSRLRARLADGSEVGLFLPRGTILRGGDRLRADDGSIIAVVAAAERVCEVRADARDLARAAYHLGNRHVAVEVGDGWLRFGADHVLADMVRGLGLAVTELDVPFEPEAGAYAAGHTHDAEGIGPRIHQFRNP